MTTNICLAWLSLKPSEGKYATNAQTHAELIATLSCCAPEGCSFLSICDERLFRIFVTNDLWSCGSTSLNSLCIFTTSFISLFSNLLCVSGLFSISFNKSSILLISAKSGVIAIFSLRFLFIVFFAWDADSRASSKSNIDSRHLHSFCAALSDGNQASISPSGSSMALAISLSVGSRYIGIPLCFDSFSILL